MQKVNSNLVNTQANYPSATVTCMLSLFFSYASAGQLFSVTFQVVVSSSSSFLDVLFCKFQCALKYFNKSTYD